MIHSTSRAKLAAALAAGAFSAVALSGPAMARPDSGTITSGADSVTETEWCMGGEVRQGREGDVCVQRTGDTGRARNDVGQLPPAIDSDPGSPTLLADDGLEYIQIGLGALAGAVFTAAAVAALGSRRRQDTPRPA
jgi:hypothetical protein